MSADPSELDALVGDILRLSGSADNIDAVAGAIGNMQAVVDNMDDIIAAPGEAAAAASSAASAASSKDDAAAGRAGAEAAKSGAEGARDDARAAAVEAQAVVARAEAVYDAPAVFRASDYLSASDLDYAQKYNYQSQNETAVTAALRTMIDDAITWMQGGNFRVAVVDFGNASYAVNDELISPTSYAKIWAQTGLGQQKMLVFRGGGGAYGAHIHCRNFVSSTITRSAGPLSGVVGPRALLPIHLPYGWRMLTKFSNLTFFGERKFTDPIGLYGWNLLEADMEGIDFDSFFNAGIWVEGCFNSRWNDVTVQSCGAQQTQGNIINGSKSGYHSRTATFTVTDNGNGTATLTASESFWLAEHATNQEYFVVNNARTLASNNNPQPSLFKITSVTSATVAIGTPVTAGTIRAGSGNPGSFLILRGTIAANSASLALNYPLSTDIGVGDYLGVYKGGSKTFTSNDLLVSRITAVSTDRLTITLSHQARLSATNVPIIVRPAMFLGQTEDLLTVSGQGANCNDLSLVNCRVENSHGYSDSVTGAVQLVGQNWSNTVNFIGSKIHGAGPTSPNFGQSGFVMLLDNCSSATFNACTTVFGYDVVGNGAIAITGEFNRIDFIGCVYGSWQMPAEACTFFIDPKTNTVGSTQINVVGGRFDAANLNRYPGTGQAVYRYGANGVDGMITMAGRIAAYQTADMDYASPPQARVSRATGVPLRLINDTNTASRQGLRLEGVRPQANATNFDTVYQSFYLTDTAGAQREFARIRGVASSVSSSTPQGQLALALSVGGTVTDKIFLSDVALFPSSSGGAALGISTLPFSSLYLLTSLLVNNVKVVGARDTGWSAWTGTGSKASKDVSTATTAECAAAIKAIIDALTTHGLIGT
ncbi:hypothetical protein [Hyphomicrobium sp. 99]|uniref:hypothetical protein n=1 Tax=Hyphomicrobium sp. 99 TaxID=1163419 RepID=UPI0012E03F13|nr:hypothetical protein [Hyphomicrobium sp. 99]